MKTANANIPYKTRAAVYKRDWYMCAICSGTSGLQIHHVVPRGQGGNDTMHNLVTLCSVCHAQIHGFIPYESEDYTAEGMTQELFEALSDIYAEDFWPYK